MADFAEVACQAMELPLEQRADLAHRLIISLDKAPPVGEESLQDLLVARQKRVESGACTTYEASETLARMRRSLEAQNRP